jgi:hypothetical protein
MIFGEPSSFSGFSSDGADDQGEYSQEEETQADEDNDEEEDDNDEDEDEEEDDEYGNEEDGPVAIVHGSEVDNEETLSDDETILVEDDEADYSSYTSEGGIGAKRANEDAAETDQDQDQDQVTTEADQKEKSINIVKYVGLRKRKRRRRPHKRVPARRPPHWKKYRPAPLLPEFPEKLSDALLTVVKNVGFLPEYGKEEKYGGHHGHNKIKGKFTKTRPITLHHGLLTEVLRRR